jgi:hypothetical protein
MKGGRSGRMITSKYCKGCTQGVRELSNFIVLSLLVSAPLVPLCTWIDINTNSLLSPKHNYKNLSVADFLADLRKEPQFPNTEISSELELRLLMLALAFKWSNIDPDYYTRLLSRYDVEAHGQEVVPLLDFLLKSHRHFVVFVDASFSNRNDIQRHGWCNMTKRDSNRIRADTGKGKRVNFFTPVSQRGIIVHPDGNSAGTVIQPGTTMDHTVIHACMSRVIEGVMACKERGRRSWVIVCDGATIQKMLKETAINPKRVHRLRSHSKIILIQTQDESE